MDDSFHLRLERTRRSLIKGVKAKIPDCKMYAYHISAAGEKLQSYWANEWALAENAILLSSTGKTLTPIRYKEPDIEDWFTHSTVPLEKEGFDEVYDNKVPLTLNFPIENLNKPALLIDLSSILEFGPENELQFKFDAPNIQEVIMEWFVSITQRSGR